MTKLPISTCVLPFKDSQAKETERGIRISRWLKEQGLNMGTDYHWAVLVMKGELHFTFKGDATSWASLLAVKEM